MLAWMPAASVYFRDPDNNLLEFISAADADPSARPVLACPVWE